MTSSIPSGAAADGNAPLVRIRDLSKAFAGVQALAGVQFDLRAGEVRESGCGARRSPYRLFQVLCTRVSDNETIASGSASGSGGTAPPPGWATVVPISASTSAADIGAATR